MKTNMLLPIFSAFLLACKQKPEPKFPVAKDKAGIGLLHCNTNKTLYFYENDTVQKPFDSLVFSVSNFGLSKGKTNFNTFVLRDRLRPYIMSEGDSDTEGKANISAGLISFAPELIFKVEEKNNDNFRVIFNEKTLETCVVRLNSKNDYTKTVSYSNMPHFDPNFVEGNNSNWFFYETWENALRRAWSVTPPKNAKFYDAPNGKFLETTNSSNFNVVDSVKGDWARFTTRIEEKQSHGWTKWKDRREIKVDIVLNGGYECP